MNRHDRRTREAILRKHQAGPDLRTVAADWDGIIPADIKTDIAKVVRSIEWRIIDGKRGGLCFWRTMTGVIVLTILSIPAQPALGGLIYRVGPDEHRDVVAFCGPGNVGTLMEGGLLGHWFIVSGDDIVDFSVGDWTDLSGISEFMTGQPALGPIQWTISPPNFFWDHRNQFRRIPPAFTPELGRAWYTGFDGEPDIDLKTEEFLAGHTKLIAKAIAQGVEFYALRERLFAVRNGHTAVRYSRLAEMVGDPVLLAKVKREERDKLLVLRNKVDITPEIARGILVEAGLTFTGGEP
jgi:hypothetical protein